MLIGDEKMAIIYDTGNKKLNFMIDTIGVLFYLMIIIIMVGGIVNILFPKPTQPTNMEFMLNPYLGLPFFFWFCTGIGIMFGIIFHGILLINVDSHNTTKELIKNEK